MERRFQYYVPFTNHTQYRAMARAREHNTMEKFILNFTHLFHVHEHWLCARRRRCLCGFPHICIEDMRTKKALSVWIPLVSVFCISGAVSGIRGKQMMPAVASERSIFSKNHDYNTYIKSFSCRDEHVRTYISGYRCTRWQKTTNRHTHTCGTATVTITIKIIRSAEAQ